MPLTTEILRDLLKREANVQDTEELDDLYLDSLLVGALEEHNADYVSIGQLPDKEGRLIVLLAWEKLCFLRASRHLEGNTSGASGIGQDRNTPYHKNIDLAAKLRKQYDSLSLRLLDDPSLSGQTIVVSNLRVRSDVLNAQVPLSKAANPPVASLSFSETEGQEGIVYLSWRFNRPLDNVHSFLVYALDGSEAIYQAWSSSTTRVNSQAKLVATLSDLKATSLKVEEVDRTLTNRFLFVVRSYNDTHSYSNEVVIAPSA